MSVKKKSCVYGLEDQRKRKSLKKPKQLLSIMFGQKS